MGRKMSVAAAKAHFAEAVKTAESGAAVVITRYGTPVAAIVPFADVAMLEQLRSPGSARGLAAIAGGWAGSAELAEKVLEVHIARTLPRPWRGTRS